MTTFKSLVGGKDVKWWGGVFRTFTRRTSTGGTLTQNAIGSVIDILEVYGNGDTYTDRTLSDAISMVGSNPCTILFQPGTWTIANNITIPATMSIMVPQGATISVSTTKTLTVSGNIIAGSYVIFDGAGTIAGSPILSFKDSYWFSGTVTDSTTPTYKAKTEGALTVTTLTANTSVSTDTISEKTSAAGVTIDGVKLKDSQPYCDVINEKTTDAGVTIDGVKLKDSQPYCDVINEKTTDAGVTIDGVLLKDNKATADTFESTVATGTPPLVVASTTEVANLRAATATGASGTGTAVYAGETGLKIIRGGVQLNGVIISGTGFTVVRNSTGYFTVTFTDAFSTVPSVVVSPYTATGDAFNALTYTPSTSSVVVRTTDLAGTLTDIGFQFIAIGPK